MRSTAPLCVAIGATIFLFCLAPSSVLAEEGLGAPAMAETENPDNLDTRTENPDSLDTGTQDPDSLVTGTDNPDALVTGTEDPDRMVEAADSVDQLEGHTSALQDLPDADAQDLKIERATLEETRERYEQEALAPQSSEDATTGSKGEAAVVNSPELKTQISAIREAKQNLERARELAAQADDTYGTMMANDYPLGEARLRIVDQRKVAHQALEAAEQRYEAALGGNAAPASP